MSVSLATVTVFFLQVFQFFISREVLNLISRQLFTTLFGYNFYLNPFQLNIKLKVYAPYFLWLTHLTSYYDNNEVRPGHSWSSVSFIINNHLSYNVFDSCPTLMLLWKCFWIIHCFKLLTEKQSFKNCWSGSIKNKIILIFKMLYLKKR